MNLRAKVAGVLAFACCGLLSAATTYNYWQAVDGDYSGRWGDAAHWSEGHVPRAGEFATVDPTREAPSATVAFSIEVDGDYAADTLIVGDPDNVARKTAVTFTGTGTVACSGTSSHIFRACSSITFDGPTFRLGGTSNVLNYTPVTVKGGSTLWLNGNLTFWKINDSLTVGPGGTVDVGSLWFNNTGNRSVTVHAGGRFVCRGQYRPHDGTEGATQAFGLVIDGGEARIGELRLTRPAAYVQMSAGTLHLVNGPTLSSWEQLRVTGGSVRYGFNVFQDASDPFYAFATNHAFAGCNVLHATNGVTFTKHGTFHVSQLRIADSANPARIDCDRLVFDGANSPFAFQYSGNRLMHLYGPTDIHVDGRDLRGFNNHYILCHGRVTVHTEDWSDPSVKRNVSIRGLGSADGSLDLVATGGGTFTYGQVWSYETMRSFTVEEGTALVLGNRDVKVGNTTEWGPLVAETLTLEKDVTVAFSAGEQHVAASIWRVDPSVRFTVTIPATYSADKVAVPSGAFPVLQDLDSKPLPDALLAQITLAGDSDGWSLVNEHGQISVVKRDPALLGTFGEFEWLGGSGANWSTAANWNGGTPAEQKDHVFGVSENRAVNFDRAMSPSGATLGSIEFLDCAPRSFSITGNQATFSKTPSVKSAARVPQVLSVGLRATGGNRQIAAYSSGPVVFAKGQNWLGKNPVNIDYVGDVRAGCGTSNIASLNPQANRGQFPAHRTCLTVLDGGNLNFQKQASDFWYENASFRVSRGGVLTFGAADGAIYSWQRKPASIVVDGTLNVGPALRGGSDQVYRGAGTLNLNGGAVATRASSRVKFADALTVNLPGDWNTAAAGGEAFALGLGATAGAPVIRVPAGWTYGVPAGVTAMASDAERAFALENGATAWIDPQGGAATLKEGISGEGTLAATNGTLVLAAPCDAAGVTVGAAAGAAVATAVEQRLGGLALAEGASATLGAAVTVDALSAAGARIDLGAAGELRTTGDADVDGVEFAFVAGGGWRTLVRAAGTVKGTPAHAEVLRYRTVAEGGLTLLQAGRRGMSILFR